MPRISRSKQRDLPFIWEEMVIPITYTEDRTKVEQILLRTATEHAASANELAADALAHLEGRYSVKASDLRPRVYFRITDNWLELTLRFVVTTHGIREVKDAMSREIVEQFDSAGIGIASAAYDIIGFRPIEMRRAGGDAR